VRPLVLGALARKIYAPEVDFRPAQQGQSVRAQRLARAAAPLTTALFRESNPVPVKYALALLGLMSPAVRLPLVELSPHLRTELGEVLLRLCDEYSECMIGNTLEGGEARRAIAG